MEKIYLVIQESNVDGEILINVVPCISLETAKELMKQEKETILNESPHYKDYEEYPEYYQIDEDEESVFINVLCDDYYENIYIQEKEIQYYHKNITTMTHYMNTYNAHNKELVEKINEVCNDEDYLPIVIIAVRAICQTCKTECTDKFGFIPYYGDDILEHLSDILMNLCDDTDLEIILKFCRKL